MSDATTALAEVLAQHMGGKAAPKDDRCPWVCICGESFFTLEGHLTAAVVAAVRGMSPDLQAELIEGEVERAEVDGKWGNNNYRGLADGTPLSRAVGPWTPEPAEEASDG